MQKKEHTVPAKPWFSADSLHKCSISKRHALRILQQPPKNRRHKKKALQLQSLLAAESASHPQAAGDTHHPSHLRALRHTRIQGLNADGPPALS